MTVHGAGLVVPMRLKRLSPFAAPAVFLLGQVWILFNMPPMWRQLADPIYQYLLNGIAITSGVTPGHTDHPGTSTQWLLGIIQGTTFGLVGQSQDLAVDVIARPEFYLTINASVMIALQTAAFAFASWRMGKFLGLQSLFVFQALILGSTPILYFTIYPVPESTVWICTITLIGLIAPAARTPRKPFPLFTLIGIGVVIGIGSTAKIIFLPVLAVVFVWLRWRDAVIASVTALTSGLLILWPVRSQFARMWEWFSSTASTSARYPDEVSRGSSLDSLVSAPISILRLFPLSVVAAVLLALMLVAASKQVRLRELGLLQIVGPLLALLGLWVFTYKAWRPNDLMAWAPLTGLLAAVLFYVLFTQPGGPRCKHRSRWPQTIALGLLALSTASFAIRVPTLITETSTPTQYDDLSRWLDQKWQQGSSISNGYGVFTQASALTYANATSGGIASQAIADRYPGWIDFNIWNSMFYRAGREGVEFMSCITLKEIAQSPRGLLLAPGRDVEWIIPNAQYEGLLAVVEAQVSGLDVFRVIDVDCGPQWYPES